MTTFKCRWLAMPLFIVLFTIECSDDTDPLSFTQDPETADERRRRGGPNGGGGDPSGNNAAELPGTLATDWMKLFLELDQNATGMRPNACARAIAYINLAAYETALPSMRDFVSNESRLQGLRIERNINRRDLDVQLALNAGYADVIDHLVLNIPQEYRDKIEALEAQNFQSYSAGVPNRTVEESLDWGEYIARQVIRYATSDREAEKQILEPQPNSYEPQAGKDTGPIQLMRNGDYFPTGNPFAPL